MKIEMNDKATRFSIEAIIQSKQVTLTTTTTKQLATNHIHQKNNPPKRTKIIELN